MAKRFTHMSKRQEGFTLIELLVVIAIIAILAAILFPVFTTAREKARQMGCVSNLKQLAMAMSQYVDDYKGAFPPFYVRGVGPIRYDQRWDLRIFSYVKNEQVYRCPSHYIDKSVSTYSANALLLGYPPMIPGVNVSKIRRASRVVLIWDGNTEKANRTIGWANGGSFFGMVASGYNVDNKFLLKHLDGDNFIFADFHVKWYPTKELAERAPIAVYTWHEISFDPNYTGMGGH